jgi:signal transduction histidine kinase
MRQRAERAEPASNQPSSAPEISWVPANEGNAGITGKRRTTRTSAPHVLRILQEVTEGALLHLDLQNLLHEMLGRIRAAMRVDNATILLTSDDGQRLVVYAARGPDEDVTGHEQVQVGHGITDTIAASRDAVIVDDLGEVEVEQPLLRATARSLVGAPLIAGDRMLGVVQVDSARRRHFTEDDRQLLERIASPLALAIGHAQFYDAEREARKRAEDANQTLQTLQAVSDVALLYARLDDLLHALLARIQRMMEVDNVAILLPTSDGMGLTLYSVQGAEEAVIGMVHVPFGEGVAGTIAATREPLIIDSLAAVPVANPFLREHFHSLLGVPVLADDKLVGVIHVDTVQQRHFTDHERLLLEALADRIAMAIAHAQGYEGVQRGREEAEQEVAAMQEVTERMDRFLSIAGHELRTPLTSLSTNIQMLSTLVIDEHDRRSEESEADYAARVAGTVRLLIQHSGRSTRRLERLIGEILDVSRIISARIELDLRPVDLVKIVRDVVDEQRQMHPERALVLDVNSHEPLFIHGDPDRIGQVVINYLSNALKYSATHLPVTIGIEATKSRASVSVRDQGVGIPQTELAHLWERFYRVADNRPQVGSQIGLGLGLYISRDIVERHGGQVGVQSIPDNGTTFWLTLPLAPPGLEQAADGADAE